MRMSYGKILNKDYAIGTSLKNIAVNTAPIVVMSFGKLSGTEKDFEPVNRTEGRKDYQLIFISKGELDFVFENKKQTLGEGSFVLFKPFEPQIYHFNPESKNTLYYFIHFSGSKAEEFLMRYGITEQVFRFDKPFSWFEQIFNEMDATHTMKFREDICNNMLITLLAIIGSALQEFKHQSNGRFADLLHLMRANCTENYPISKYAEYLGYSEMYFIAYFKKQMKSTPYQYIMNHRMQIAKQLLLTTKNSVKSIALQVGYPNPRYFSRVFYKWYQKTPSQMRQTE